MIYAAEPPKKDKILWYVQYQRDEMARLGVDVRLNTKATPEDVAALEPYAVLVAAGAGAAGAPVYPGIQGAQVCTAIDVLAGRRTLSGQQVVVIGAGMTGLETAEYLSSQGNQVSVYDLLPEVAAGEHFQNIIDVEKRLEHVPQHTGHRLVEITGEGCLFEDHRRRQRGEGPLRCGGAGHGYAPQPGNCRPVPRLPQLPGHRHLCGLRQHRLRRRERVPGSVSAGLRPDRGMTLPGL